MSVWSSIPIAVLLALNALYVAAEFSAIAVRGSQLAPPARTWTSRAQGICCRP
jgi:CBS domain containing-hemolysin-like protein